MGILDRLFGKKDETREDRPLAASSSGGGQSASRADEQALKRYRYMVQTAPPEVIEQAHQEAFAKLTPAQRAQVLRELAAATPEQERAAIGDRDDPKTLARLATRAEMRQPGLMERTFSRPSMGGMMAGTIFSSLLAGFVGSMIAQQFFDSAGAAGFAESGMGEPIGGGQPAETMVDDIGGGDFGGDF